MAAKTVFKFNNWQPTKTVLTAKQKPFDVCAPVDDKDRFVHLENRNTDMIVRNEKTIKQLIQANAAKNAENKVSYAAIPKVVNVRLGDMMIVIDTQRPVDEDHQINKIGRAHV